MSRSIKEIEAEERQLRNRLIVLETELKNYPYAVPDFVDEAALLNGTYPPGHRIKRMIRTDIEVVKRQLAALQQERNSLNVQTTSSANPGGVKLTQQEEVVRRFQEIKAAKPAMSTTDALNQIAEEFDKSSDAIKKSYYDGLKTRRKGRKGSE
jgi:hypothetical protein